MTLNLTLCIDYPDAQHGCQNAGVLTSKTYVGNKFFDLFKNFLLLANKRKMIDAGEFNVLAAGDL